MFSKRPSIVILRGKQELCHPTVHTPSVRMISLTTCFFRRYFWQVGVSCGADEPVMEHSGMVHCKKSRQFCPCLPENLWQLQKDQQLRRKHGHCKNFRHF